MSGKDQAGIGLIPHHSETVRARQPGLCGKLRKTMYGSLDAAQRWEEHHAQALEICHFFHEGLQTYILVQGDDFFSVGRREGGECTHRVCCKVHMS